MEQLIQLGGALCVLLAFVLVQFRRMSPESLAYLVLNAVGSGALAVLAALDRQWGFLLLEGVWAIVSTFGIAQRLLRKSE